MNRTHFLNDCSNIFQQVLLITVLAIFCAWSVNLMRGRPAAWVWAPPRPAAPVLENSTEFRAALDHPDTVLVDTRGALFYKMGHLPGAISLPVEDTDEERLKAWRAALPAEARIILYCSDDLCPMADQMAEKMIGQGMTPTIYKPGYAAWEAEGLPVEAD